MTTFNLTYSAETNKASLLALLATKGTVVFSLDSLRVVSIETAETKETLEALAGVVLAEEDIAVTIAPHTATWHLQRLVTEALPLKTNYHPVNSGDSVVVYLMDSGVDSTHAELSEATIINLHSYNSDFSDTVGHGTSLASLINGKTVGVSKNAIVKSVKIPFGSSTLGVLLTAFDAVLADHSASADVKVVNCSWTIPKSQLLDGKITELQSAGLVVVAAAGNSGVAADTLSPVGLNSVIGVAASDAYDRVIAWASGSSSNWGPEVDVTAPGVEVMTADITGGLSEKSGTSVAAAVVSGAICQYIKQNSASTASQIQTLFLNSTNDDMLFRNETIYGTTPNKIAAVSFEISNKFTTPSKTLFPVKREIDTTVVLTLSEINNIYPAEDVIITYEKRPADPSTGLPAREIFPWISMTQTGKVATFTMHPTSDVAVGLYSFFATIKVPNKVPNVADVSHRFIVGVYQTSETELDMDHEEKYLIVNETGNTVLTITPAYCSECGQCGKSECHSYTCGGVSCNMYSV